MWKRMIIIGLLSVVGLANLPAQAANVDYNFRWEASRNIFTGMSFEPKEISYLVYLQRGTEPALHVATVQDTIFVLDAEPGVVQRLRVIAVTSGGQFSPPSQWSDPVYFEENAEQPELPPAAHLQPNYPNPFNPQTSIVYGVPSDIATGDRVQLDIFSLQGQLVRRLEVDRSPGWHESVWDGTNEQGVVAAAGTYVTRLVVGSMVETTKMTMLK